MSNISAVQNELQKKKNEKNRKKKKNIREMKY